MSVQKPQVFTLEYKYFDRLDNPIEIALYAYIVRSHTHSGLLDTELAEVFFAKMGVSHRSLEEAYKKLFKIGFLNKGN
jgi:plasmid replication initiation protein